MGTFAPELPVIKKDLAADVKTGSAKKHGASRKISPELPRSSYGSALIS